jgi:uncharacterized protein
MDKKTEDFYERLKIKLDESTNWPTTYLYKFIVPSINDNVVRVENAFDSMGAIIKTTQSKTGKFTSISVDVIMESSQKVIDKYIEVSEIEGIVSL